MHKLNNEPSSYSKYPKFPAKPGIADSPTDLQSTQAQLPELKSKVHELKETVKKLSYFTVSADPPETLKYEGSETSDKLIRIVSIEVTERLERAKNLIFFNLPDQIPAHQIENLILRNNTMIQTLNTTD